MSLQHEILIGLALWSPLSSGLTYNFTPRLEEEGGSDTRKGRFHSWQAGMEGIYHHKRLMGTITL